MQFNGMKFLRGYTIEQATADHVPLLGAIEIAAAGIFPPDSIPDHIQSDSVPVDSWGLLGSCPQRLPEGTAKSMDDQTCSRDFRNSSRASRS